ncbi:hypothetical protein M3Y97_00294900 [Aphelenchoides bicaudatus]|nr:hypothetical protein M3Y97_00294900 [Aphelenchoides bicaudatus]
MPPNSMSTIHESSTENVYQKHSMSTASTTTQNNDDEHKELPEQMRTFSISDKKTPWTSVIVAAVLAFCSAIQFSLYFSSTWPFLQTLDPNVTEQFYGLVISAYSFGQIIGGPLFGFLSNKMRNVRIPLTICLTFSLTGNIIYIIAQMFPPRSLYLILTARLIVGIGAGNISILKSYVMMASNVADRSRAIAMVTGAIATGSMIGPGLQMAFTWSGYPGIKLMDNLLINMYTLPAVAACIINIVGLISLWLLFVERYSGLANEKTKGEVGHKKLPKPDIVAVLIVHLTLFGQRFVFTNLETLLPVISQTVFGWKKAEVLFNLGMAHSILSMVALAVNLIFVTFKMERLLNFRAGCLCAIGGLIVFHLITLDWPFLSGSLKTYSQQEYEFALLNGSEITGCNVERYNWCKDARQLNAWVFYGAYILFIGSCFPSINITLNTLFSKILGPRRISTHQGLLQTTGAVARLTGPLLISSLYTISGLRLSWTLEIILLSFVIVCWLKFYDRMVPLQIEGNRQSLKSNLVLVSPSTKSIGDKQKVDDSKRSESFFCLIVVVHGV